MKHTRTAGICWTHPRPRGVLSVKTRDNEATDEEQRLAVDQS